jgi:hypothetical protein
VTLDPAPLAPTGLTATAGNGQVQLAWTPVSGATSYSVYQGTSAGGEGAKAVMSAITNTTALVTPLSNGTTYYFSVSANSATRASGPSSEVFATPAVNAGAGGSGGGGGGAFDPWSLLGIAALIAVFRRRLRSAT